MNTCLSERQLRRKNKETKRNHPIAEQTVGRYRTELEQRYGIPIVFERLTTGDVAQGTVRALWQQRTRSEHHSIDLRACDTWLRPHRLAHELMHIDLECQAHQAGMRMTYILSPNTCQLLLDHWGSNQYKQRLVFELFSYSANVALDLIVEQRLAREFPILSAAQCLSLFQVEHQRAGGGRLSPALPADFRRAIRALEGASALLTDQLSGDVGRCFARFRGLAEGRLAKRLYEESRAVISKLTPAGHYRLVDRFAELLGFPGLHAWNPRPLFEILAEANGHAPFAVMPTEPIL